MPTDFHKLIRLRQVIRESVSWVPAEGLGTAGHGVLRDDLRQWWNPPRQ
jgi:hypothetical protein